MSIIGIILAVVILAASAGYFARRNRLQKRRVISRLKREVNDFTRQHLAMSEHVRLHPEYAAAQIHLDCLMSNLDSASDALAHGDAEDADEWIAAASEDFDEADAILHGSDLPSPEAPASDTPSIVPMAKVVVRSARPVRRPIELNKPVMVSLMPITVVMLVVGLLNFITSWITDNHWTSTTGAIWYVGGLVGLCLVNSNRNQHKRFEHTNRRLDQLEDMLVTMSSQED